MTRTEHLLTMLAEECAEVAQRCSKALRFGLTEVQPGQDLSNVERIRLEMLDLLAVYQIAFEARAVPSLGILTGTAKPHLQAKMEKVEKYLAYSTECGTLTSDPEPERAGG